VDLHELNWAQECYQMINIKLDKWVSPLEKGFWGGSGAAGGSA